MREHGASAVRGTNVSAYRATVATAIVEAQQLGDLVQGKPQRPGAPDETQARDVRWGVEPIARSRVAISARFRGSSQQCRSPEGTP